MKPALAAGLLIVTAFAVPPGTAGAASINSLYDMDRMLFEPHPLAHQYGTRWKPFPVAPRPMAPVLTRPAPAAPPPMAPALSPRLKIDPGTAPKPPVKAVQAVRPVAPVKVPTRRRVQRPTKAQAQSRRSSKAKGGGIFSEIRVGALAHDQGPFSSNKEEGIDAQIELRFQSPDFLGLIWSPYPHIGADINSSGNTSSVWLGLVWEKPVWKKMFVGWSMGGAYHNGETNQGTGALDEKELGCNPLFRLAINAGWRFGEHHSLDLILDHISNAKLCDTNEGLENVGVRYGSKF